MMNEFLTRLRAGQPQIGMCAMYPSPGVLERIAGDWDWIWIDGQHGQIGYAESLNLVRACDLVNRPALLRVPGHDFGTIGMALDTGATGIIVPCVDTPEQAQNVVNAAKFPPLGKRSYGGRRPVDRAGRSYADNANQDTLLLVQIESPEAIQNAEAIAALPGVDALFLGPDDLMLRRGYGMNTPRSRENLGADMGAVMEACRKHKKLGAMVGVGEEMFNLSLEYGFNLIVAGGDVVFLANSSAAASAQARELIQQRKGSQSQPSVAVGDTETVNSPY